MAKTRAEFLWDHVAIWLSGLVLLLTAVKLYAFSHGQPETVAAVLRTSGVGGLLAAMFIVLLPSATVLFLSVAAIDLAEATREEDRLRGPIVATVVSGLAALVFAPEPLLVQVLTLLGVMLIYSVVAIVWRRIAAKRGRQAPWLLRKSGDRESRKSAALLLVLAVPVMLIAVAFTDTAWLPKELVSTKDGRSVTGYVLADGSSYWSIAEAESRQVLLVPAESVSTRVICSDPDRRSLLADILWDPPGPRSGSRGTSSLNPPLPAKDCR